MGQVLHISLSRLTLTDFRNYRRLAALRSIAAMSRWSGPMARARPIFSKRCHLLIPGRGLRNAAYAEMVARTAPGRLGGRRRGRGLGGRGSDRHGLASGASR